MKRKIILIIAIAAVLLFPLQVCAQTTTYIVKQGDSMWKIAVKHQIGVSEIISANPQVKNPNLIYPGQKLNIPTIDNVKALENQVIEIVNAERVKRGLQPLTQNWELSRVARYKSADMAKKGYFSHTSPTYGSPFKMMEDFGIRYTAAGENIAYGARTPKEVMTMWMNSTGHRNNILSQTYNQIGVGVAQNSRGVYYWTQMFIKAAR
ncbi:MAG: SafA/ExsA family spore coat assembly protein [Acetivibrionales bacterium]|jgi:uncharacterized YkwD family protein/spore coat assembly protein SafA